MKARVTVTKEIVLKIKNYLDDPKYSGLTQEELALITGVSSSTISRIGCGNYDYLLEESEPPINTGDVNVAIDYDTLKHLVACEYVVNTLIKQSQLSEQSDEILFTGFKVVHGVLKAYVPELVNNRLAELREGRA